MFRASLIALSVIGSLAAPLLATSPAAAQAYGPDTCQSGLVWREAFQGDHVCVRPWVRAKAAADNDAAPYRIYPNGRCVQGFVWREANPYDHVCVTPAVRARTASENYYDR